MQICVISDPHVGPNQDLSRFNQLAKFLNQYRPQYLVCLGDFASLDSLSAHQQKGTLKHAKRPTFAADIKVVKEAQDRLFGSLKYEPSAVHVQGNHEDRFDRYIDKNPELNQLYGGGVSEALGYVEYWYNYPYRQYVDISGIRFTHVPHTGMGRAISGSGKTRRVSVESTIPVVFGHGHDLSVTTHGEITGGPANRMAISAPAFMNDGNIQKYAKGNHTGWSYGFLMIRPQGSGRVPAFDYVSMKDLKGMYK